MRISYAPGDWTVVVRSGTLIVLPPDTGRSSISGIWEALSESHSLEAALRAVTKAFDTDVTAMPPFAIASLQSRLQVMVRGRITIRSRNGQTETEISGAHVTTWNEQVLHDQNSMDISFDEAAPPEPQLPLEAGVVRAAGLVISLTESGPGQEGSPSTGGLRQSSWGSGGDQTINPTDLDVFGDDDGGQVGTEEPAETAETDDLDLVDETSSPTEESRQALANNTAGTGSDLIESVPWMKSGTGSSPTHAGPAEPEPAPAEPRSAEPGSVEPDQASAPPALDDDIDHDGQTVMRSELNAPPASGSSTGGMDGTDAAATRGPSTAPIVLARMCQSGHANPPTNANCSTCGSPITSEPCQVRRPSLGSMRMSDGEVVELDRSVIVGRQPSMSRVQGNIMPRMVQVRSGEGDISRSHVEVQLEGWHVLLRDLNSTNGTFLIREGQPPRRLAQGEQAMLLDGDVAELGDDVWLRFEGLK